MFYSQFILAKKGPLGTIWIAAHLERKLRKNQVADTDIGMSVDSILFPEAPIALRLSSHLLLGVVRIYSRKVSYLFDDCSEALLKIKQAFRSAAVDLPPEESTAPYHSITLPETFDLDDFEVPDNDILQGNYVDHHISSREQITLQDTMEGVVFSTSQFGLDERFGDGDASGLDLDEELLMDKVTDGGHTGVVLTPDDDPRASGQSMETRKHDEYLDGLTANSESMLTTGIENQINNFDGDTEPVEPCTPRLWEEPNLSNAQETSTCEDHLEVDNHSLPESAQNVNIEQASSKLVSFSVQKGGMEWPLINDANSDLALTVSTTANGYLPGNIKHNELEVQEKSPASGVTVEHTAKDNLFSSSSNQSFLADQDRAVHGLEEDTRVGEFEELNIMSKEPVFSLIDAVNEDRVEPLGEPFNKGELSSNDGVENFLDSNHIAGLALHECVSSARVDDAISGGTQVEMNSSSTTANLPAPEKLLSVPDEVTGVASNLLPDTTPGQGNKSGNDGADSSSNSLAGKKRNFTESSLKTQSMNIAESSGIFSTRSTAGSIPDDDDLLSSILVGRRSSVLKVKPTPPLEITSKKRQRSAARINASKRKVLVDDTMVLHGDTIRQQLLTTEDIRRQRKKAPCTRPEISMLQKQFWEDELFCETIFTGMTMELTSLHNQTYDLRNISISQYHTFSSGPVAPELVSKNIDESSHLKLVNDKDGRPNLEVELENKDGCETVAVGDNCEPRTVETPMPSDNQLFETVNLEGCHTQMQIDLSYMVENRASENGLLEVMSTIEIDGKTHLNEELLIRPGFVKVDAHASVEVDEPFSGQDQMLDVLPVDDKASDNLSSSRNIEADSTVEKMNDNAAIEDEFGIKEFSLDVVVGDDSTAIIKDYETINIEHAQFGIPCATLNTVTSSEGMEETMKYELEIGDEDAEVGCKETNDNVYGGGLEKDVSHSPVLDVDSEILSLGDGEKHCNREDLVLAETDVYGSQIDRNELEFSAFGTDTEFLNVDDDEVAEEDGDLMPNAEETQLIDNSGWSSRTRAVAKYLQNLFDKESERERKVLPIDNLLAGKTRREASRMFFETLVLKTKDYVHVEQSHPFENINLFPQAKLMKSDFRYEHTKLV